jgi:hypothetical protein
MGAKRQTGSHRSGSQQPANDNAGLKGSDEGTSEPLTRTAEQARQGRIVLNTPLRRAVFFGAIVAFVLFSLFLALSS